MRFIASWIACAVATMVAVALVPGIEAVGGTYAGPIMCALALALVNATLKPITRALSLPLTLITFGLFLIVVNALMLEVASWLSRNIFHAGISIDSFGAALITRLDDQPATIAHRLEVYEQVTAPVVGWYEKAGVLRRIDGSGTADEVAALVEAAI